MPSGRVRDPADTVTGLADRRRRPPVRVPHAQPSAAVGRGPAAPGRLGPAPGQPPQPGHDRLQVAPVQEIGHHAEAGDRGTDRDHRHAGRGELAAGQPGQRGVTGAPTAARPQIRRVASTSGMATTEARSTAMISIRPQSARPPARRARSPPGWRWRVPGSARRTAGRPAARTGRPRSRRRGSAGRTPRACGWWR